MKSNRLAGVPLSKLFLVGACVPLLAGLLAICGCEKSRKAKHGPPSGVTFSPPADHTKDKDGFKHKPGYKRESDTCKTCHGQELKGGDGPSCYTCHDKKWK